MIVKLIRLASFVICAIVIASFVVFVSQQATSASGSQQAKITADTSTSAAAGTETVKPAKESELHREIDNASETFTSPFKGLVSSQNSEWLTRIVELLGALLLYGFGLGYIARMVKVRV